MGDAGQRDTGRGIDRTRGPEGAPALFAPADRVLPTLLARQATRYGDRPLLVFGETRWSFIETAAVAAASAHRLIEAGIGAGDRIAILCPNRPEFLEIYLGCAWMGAIAVPINVALRGDGLRHVLRDAAPALIAVEASLAPVLANVEPELVPERAWIIGAEEASPLAGAVPLPALGDAAPPAPVRPGDTVAILYTSGTTGPPKGVCCPQAQMFWWGVHSARALGIREGDVLLTTLPLFHTNALNAFYQALVNGCTYVLEPKFSASRFWTRVRESGATVSYLLGAMAAILIAQPASGEDRGHGLRVALGGGVPAPHHAVFRERFGVPLVDGYGSTETNFVFASPITSDSTSSLPCNRPGGMGRLMEGAQALIVDADDAPLPDGEAGELLLRPTEPHAFASGYFGLPEKTVEAWQNLWFHTGDRVVREPDGHYRFIDRMKDAIRRRGENVSAWEVEQVLSGHPAVAACAAYPLPSELGEDEVAVAVQLESGAALSPEDVVAHCQGRLAAFAVPRFVRFVDAMPLTENGKVKKVALRAEGVAAEVWDRESAGRGPA